MNSKTKEEIRSMVGSVVESGCPQCPSCRSVAGLAFSGGTYSCFKCGSTGPAWKVQGTGASDYLVARSGMESGVASFISPSSLMTETEATKKALVLASLSVMREEVISRLPDIEVSGDEGDLQFCEARIAIGPPPDRSVLAVARLSGSNVVIYPDSPAYNPVEVPMSGESLQSFCRKMWTRYPTWMPVIYSDTVYRSGQTLKHRYRRSSGQVMFVSHVMDVEQSGKGLVQSPESVGRLSDSMPPPPRALRQDIEKIESVSDILGLRAVPWAKLLSISLDISRAVRIQSGSGFMFSVAGTKDGEDVVFTAEREMTSHGTLGDFVFSAKKYGNESDRDTAFENGVFRRLDSSSDFLMIKEWSFEITDDKLDVLFRISTE